MDLHHTHTQCARKEWAEAGKQRPKGMPDHLWRGFHLAPRITYPRMDVAADLLHLSEANDCTVICTRRLVLAHVGARACIGDVTHTHSQTVCGCAHSPRLANHKRRLKAAATDVLRGQTSCELVLLPIARSLCLIVKVDTAVQQVHKHHLHTRASGGWAQPKTTAWLAQTGTAGACGCAQAQQPGSTSTTAGPTKHGGQAPKHGGHTRKRTAARFAQTRQQCWPNHSSLAFSNARRRRSVFTWSDAKQRCPHGQSCPR
jgi:hypothetical protein